MPTTHFTTLSRLFGVLLFSSLLACMAGCEKKGGAEALGAQVDQAVEEAGQTLQETADKVEASTDAQLEKAKDAMREHPDK